MERVSGNAAATVSLVLTASNNTALSTTSIKICTTRELECISIVVISLKDRYAIALLMYSLSIMQLNRKPNQLEVIKVSMLEDPNYVNKQKYKFPIETPKRPVISHHTTKGREA